MNNPFHILAPLTAAGVLAWIAYRLAAWLSTWHVSSGRVLGRNFHGLPATTPSRQAEWGSRLAHRLLASRQGQSLSLDIWGNHLAWAQRGGHYPGKTLGNVVFTACLYALGALAIFPLRPVPAMLLLPVIAFAFPLISMRSKANRVRRKTLRALPEIAAILAAEMSAGVTAAQAIGRAAEILDGPVADLLKDAVAHAGKTSRPLFGIYDPVAPVTGALVAVFERAGLPDLHSFAVQVDLVAGKGVDAPRLMNETAAALAAEYRQRVETEREKLGGRLTTYVAFFFFFPVVALILASFLVPIVTMFQR